MKNIFYYAAFLLSLSTFAASDTNHGEICIDVGCSALVVPGTHLDLKPSVHKYYLSVSNVTYSSKAQSLQMVSRYFIDDLEDVLNERLDEKMELGNVADLPDLLPVLDRYFSRRITMKVDGKTSVPKVIGAEYDVDQIVIYIEIPVDKKPTDIEMSNKSMFELFPEQKNLTHFKISNERKSLLNSGDTPTDRVKF
jgi:hypothetical protein